MLRHFAYQQAGDGWGGPRGRFAPPWAGHHRPPIFGMWGRRGPFGPGGPFGPEGPWGERRRFFGRGDVKFALLALLNERPMHGYEMMKALEEQSGGFYKPSAGTIYPTLQLLEDSDLVTAQEVEGKKVYHITDAGKQALSERQQGDEPFAPPFRGPFGPHSPQWNTPEIQALRGETMEVMRLFALAGRQAFTDPAKARRLHDMITRLRTELAAMLDTSGPEQL
jgi:DNA-binding PadR family transcriptional regulator